MLERLRLRVTLGTFFIIAVVLFAAVQLGQLIGKSGFDYRMALVGAAIATGALILLNKRGYEIGFLIWIGLFFLGYRTIPIIEGFKLHPLVAFILLLIPTHVSFNGQPFITRVRMPISLIVFAILILWGLLLSVLNQLPIGISLYVFLNYMIVVPVFMVTIYTLERANNWRAVVQVFYTTSALIALLGCTEYFFPGIRNIAPAGLMQSDIYLFADDGFKRGNFIFWGAPTASYICLLALPMSVPLLRWAKDRRQKIFLLIQLILMLLGIYISGYRSMWIYAVVGLSLMVMSTGVVRSIIIAICLLPLLNFAPPEATKRLSTITEFAQGTRYDGSLNERLRRYNVSLAKMNEAPLGAGWSSSGWVLNDFMQAGSDAGIPTLIVFAIWYLYTLLQAAIVYFRMGRDPTMGAVLISLIMAGGIFMTDGVAYLPQNLIPIWFVWALTHVRTQQLRLGIVTSADIIITPPTNAPLNPLENTAPITPPALPTPKNDSPERGTSWPATR